MAGVGLDGVQRDEQPLADLLVGTTLRDQLQHRQLAAAQGLATAASDDRQLRQARQQFTLGLAIRARSEVFT
ncbi:hypothetical protein D3C71_1463750 [compost metagenome]